MPESLLSIGELARLAGLRPSALRYYEQRKLLAPHSRVAGRRRYLRAAVERLQVIEFAKTLGFSLTEVGILLGASGGDEQAKQELRRIATSKLPEVDARLRQLGLQRQMLLAAQRCHCPTLDTCARAARLMRQTSPMPGL